MPSMTSINIIDRNYDWLSHIPAEYHPVHDGPKAPRHLHPGCEIQKEIHMPK